MKKIFLLTGIIFSLHVLSFSQHTKAAIPSSASRTSSAIKSPEFTTGAGEEIKPVSIDLTWRPILHHVRVKHHTNIPDMEFESIKAAKQIIKNNAVPRANGEENASRSALITPVKGRNFKGNSNTGTSPLDNSIAISNEGKIVSVANASIDFYNENGTRTFTNSIQGFFDDPDITTICDPVVIYDSGADKFIFFAQECSGHSSNSFLLICFSQTNDPNDGWWNYKLNGNPAANSTWFDYPKLAVSTNELYITGNSYNNNSNFQDVLLYQIQKNNGFTGGNLNWQYWNNMANAFTLLPVSYGHEGNYGPGIYLVGTQSSGADYVDLYDLTNDMSSSNEELNQYTIPTTAFSPAADGYQSGTDVGLDNGDCRSLSGFYLDGIIHFVFHSDYEDSYNGINYNRLDVSSLTNTSSVYGLADYEYSYPSVASFAASESDRSVMIGFGRTGADIFPEIRVVSCDHNLNWSPSVRVKNSQGYVHYTATNGEPERWGDYTGMCRKHSAPEPTVWMNGMYSTIDHKWETWISEIQAESSTSTDETHTDNQAIQVYPNPADHQFTTSFELQSSTEIRINVFDLQGKLIKSLFEGTAVAGKNIFTCNTSHLSPGTYFIKIETTQEILQNEKIIISH